jgi:hypothetical protein
MRAYGGLAANDGAPGVAPSEINRAGKTTRFNGLAATKLPTLGCIRSDAGEVTGRPALGSRARGPVQEMAGLGIARTFHITALSPLMAVSQKVRPAVLPHRSVASRALPAARQRQGSRVRSDCVAARGRITADRFAAGGQHRKGLPSQPFSARGVRFKTPGHLALALLPRECQPRLGFLERGLVDADRRRTCPETKMPRHDSWPLP